LSRRYQVAYVGNDSLDHVVDVTAENHDAAVEVVRRNFEADVVIAVRRAPKCDVRLLRRLVWLALATLFAVAAFFALRTDRSEAVEKTTTESPADKDADNWGRP